MVKFILNVFRSKTYSSSENIRGSHSSGRVDHGNVWWPS